MNPAAIRLEGAPNFRDFGACTTADGRTVRPGRLFRSGTLSMLSPADFAQLAALQPQLVCDLRSQAEVTLHPTVWPADLQPQRMHVDVSADLRAGDPGIRLLLRNDPTARGAETMMLRTYRQIPKAVQSHLRPLFGALAQGEGLPVIIHCTAGKDRTGVLAALLLTALGVPHEQVLADYLLTRRHIDAQLVTNVTDTLAMTLGTRPDPDVVQPITDVRTAYLDAAFQAIDEEHGSVHNYLAQAGLDNALLDRLRHQLLTP